MRLGPYEIIAPLAEGGMGQVFRARDPRIGRDVAIKLLPAAALANPDLLRRFEQESRTAGSLNHPNLVTIYDVGADNGSPYIVMELLDGETLRDRIGNGHEGNGSPAIPQRKAVDYAVQLATGLAAAHEKGIIHRDLKPENVFITRDGRVKILDFGLAKLKPAVEDTRTETRTEQRGTSPGTVMGTVGYMSPEQVRGEDLDHRTDIFSFGTILYEMLSGRRAFRGKSAAETMSAILREDPPELSASQLASNPALTHIVRHCLEKNPNERFQSARDLAFDLQIASSSSSSGPVATQATRRPWMLVAGALLLAITAAIIAWRARNQKAAAGSAVVPQLRSSQLTFRSGMEAFPSIAPDGKTFVFVSDASGNNDIYLQRIDGQNAINLTKDSPAEDTQPVFSPDGSFVVFRSERDGGGLFVMGATGESARRISDFCFNPSWSPDAKEIVCSTERVDFVPQSRGTNSELWIIDVASGQKRLLTDKHRGAQPAWSPSGQRIAFWGMNPSAQRDLYTIDATAPKAEAKLVLDDPPLDWNPIWSPDGKYLYFGSDRGGTMNFWRIAVDESSGDRRGQPEQLPLPSRFAGHFSIARDGQQILFSALETAGAIRRAPVADARRSASTVVSGSILFFSFEVSPDGEWIAFSNSGVQEDLYVARVDTGEIRQITNDAHRDRGPSWTPDGRQILFYSNRTGRYEFWRINVDGSGLTQLTERIAESLWFPQMSPDGTKVFGSGFTSSIIIPMGEGVARKGELIASTGIFAPSSWSPDSQKIVGIFIEPRGGVARSTIAIYDLKKRAVTTIREGGDSARWLPDGRTIVMLDGEQLVVQDLITGKSRAYPFRKVTNLLVAGRANPFWTDGKEVFWVDQLNEADVWLVRLQ